MEQTQRGRTSEIEMIATRVVQNQANVCRVVMEHIKEQLGTLVERIEGLEKTVITMDKSLVDVKGRLRLFTIVAAAVGFVVGIVKLIELF